MTDKTPSQREKYLFDVNNYKIVTEINRGGFGVVNLVKDQTSEKEYAAKTNFLQNKNQNKLYISREIRILIQVQHPTIIQFRGFSYVDFENHKNITILMDYMKNGSLADLIAKEEKGLSPSEYNNTKRQIILIGIARGMMLLHKLHIIHRDLKPENILLDDDLYPHISDFGLSKFFDPNHSTSQSMADIGTAAYMAPEVIATERYNTKADVYSFGILMYEILSGKRAYQNLLTGKKKISIFIFKQKILEGLRPEIEKGSMKKSHKIMIEKCLSKDPKDRPTFSELYKKLSLSSEDDFLNFDYQEEQKINYEEEEDNDNDEIEVNNTFCIDSVDYDEVFCYIESISEEPTQYNQQISNVEVAPVKVEEIEKLENEVENLKNLLKESNNEVELLKEDLARQIDEMKQDHARQIDEIKQDHARQIDEINKKHDTAIDNLTKEINRLKEENQNRNSIVDYKYYDKDFPGGVLYTQRYNVKITAGGHKRSDARLIDLTARNGFANYNYEASVREFLLNKSESDSYIEFDFIDKKIQLKSYLIYSNGNPSNIGYHPRSWRIVGYDDKNDQYSWKLLDRHENESVLNSPNIECVFECKSCHSANKYRYIRYIQEANFASCGLTPNNYNVNIGGFDLFGTIFNE